MEDELIDGEIVWVKVSNSWWPGEIMGESRLSEEFLSSLRKKPLAVVKFFQEDSYEYVKNPNFIFKYNCPRKNEFLRKGLEQYRAKMKHMEKFPADVMHAERVTGGDPDIVNSTDFQPQKKERYSGLFQDGRSPVTPKGGMRGLKEKPNTASSKLYAIGSGRKTMHEVRILAQPSSTSTTDSETGAASRPEQNDGSPAAVAQPVSSSPGQVYHCYKCNNYSANRQNLIMLHIKHCRMSYSVGGLSSASSNTTPMARKVSREKVNESAEEEDHELDIKVDHSRRSLLKTGKGKSLEATPISSIELMMVPLKDEPSSEKRVRGGRKPAASSETHKQKKTAARRRNRRTLSPDVDEMAVVKSIEEDDPSEDVDIEPHRQKEDGALGSQAEMTSESINRDGSAIHHPLGTKNSSDVKLKNELLADWSEDEQEDDEGVKESEQASVEKKTVEEISVAEKKIPQLEISSSIRTAVAKASTNKRQQKETRQETSGKQTQASKKAIKVDAKNDASAMRDKDELSDRVKVAEKDLESSPDDGSTSPVAAATTLPVSETSTATSLVTAMTTVPSGATTTPTASPCATIKYRNIPKKQKREFIEVTNDDVSTVQEKYAVPSREGSTASSSSTTGSNELCIGSGSQATAAAPAPAAERPISAKQLILNRATRGSSKSLSGDENTTVINVTAADDSSGGTTTTTVATGSESSSTSVEQISHLDDAFDDAKKKTQDAQHHETSCFDFNEDEEERQPEVSSQISTIVTKNSRMSTSVNTAADASQEEDRDIKLGQEIDSLLCEMEVPKLSEDLNNVMAAVSDKIDCNRTLPPKERGKRIFKTRNKTVAGAASSSSIRSSAEEVDEEPEAKVLAAQTDANDAKNRINKKPQVETEEKQHTKDENEQKKQEDHQNPSVTSSAMTEEMVAVEPMDVDHQPQQQQSVKKKRKSEEVLLPDSSGGNGEPALPSLSTRRRGKFGGKSVTEGTEQKPSDTYSSLDERESSSSARKSKRNRREFTTTATVASSDDKVDTEDPHHNTSERVSGSKKEPIATVEATGDGTTTKNDETSPLKPVKKQSIEIPATPTPNSTKPKREENLLQLKKSPPVPSSTSIDVAAPTATDLQVAEALINLPAAAATMAPVSSSEEKHIPTTMNDAVEEAVVAKEATTTSTASVVRQTTAQPSSLAKSINPRKRHLQSMMLTTPEESKPQAKKPVVLSSVSSDSSVLSVVVSKADDTLVAVVPTKQDAPSIPEKNSDNESIKSVENEETVDELTANDRLDISNMPIVMDDSELLVEDASSSVSGPANSAVVKSVNGAANTSNKVGETSTRTTSIATPRDKRQTTVVASVKGGRASKEQIVITSKGTVLTTSTANVTVASKLSTTSKPSVSVTSSITLASSCLVASSTPTTAPNGSSSTMPPLQPPPSATVVATSVNTQSVPPKIILTKKPLPNTATEGVKSSKLQEHRLSGDGGSSSVSSSSGSDAGSKKSHRVLRLTPEKLKEFSRLGYIEDRQGKGKMLSKSGMRELYGKQAQLKQQKKSVPISTKIVTTTGGGGAEGVGSDSTTGSTEVASSGSNVVIAAAADSSVQESSATAERATAASDPSVADMDVDEEVEQQNNKMTMELAPASGTAIVVDGSSPTSSATTSSGPVAEVILGSPAELTMVGSLVEATSSSGSSAPTAAAAAAAAGSGVQESSQLVAVTAENFGGPPHLFYLCSVRDETFVRVNDELLYLDASNQLVALPEQQHPTSQQQQQQGQHPTQPVEDIIHQAEVILPTIGSNGAELAGDGSGEGGANVTLADGSSASVVNDGTQQSFLLNTQDGQHIILDQQSLMALAAGGDTSHIITADGQQIVLQETAQEWLAALSAGQQQQQQTGTVSTLVTPEGTQIIVAHETAAGLIELQEHPVLMPSDIIQVNPNTTIETNAVLTKPPIMSTVEVPTKNGIEPAASRASEKKSATMSPRMATGNSSVAAAAAPSGLSLPSANAATSSNLDETLAAVIGHVPSNPHVPTSLELPITVTNPVIAKTSTASSRMNAAALFPLTTTATAVSSLTGDTISAVVLVSGGAEAPGTIDRVPPPSTTPPLAFPPAQKGGESVVREALREDDGKSCPTLAEPALTDEPCVVEDEDDIQIPNTPESQHVDERQQQQRLDDEFSDLDDAGRHVEDGEQLNDTRNHLLVDADEANSNCSEIIAIQPNVVVLDAELLLDSPPNDDGIDDEMENDSEDDEQLAVVRQHQQPHQQHRSRHVAAVRSTNGEGDGRPDTLNLAEYHNSSNNDSGIDTSMASAGAGGGGGGSAGCEATVSGGAPVRSATIVER
ncbi:mucin-17 [Anopheles maculipalpis]|uniref:mucin-17 n=1 Tax=Anopheles maculipalpis TaxID=1496333 RepID=UPI0021595A90|nr:mucin-17 [Anopheles maculipalpis]